MSASGYYTDLLTDHVQHSGNRVSVPDQRSTGDVRLSIDIAISMMIDAVIVLVDHLPSIDWSIWLS